MSDTAVSLETINPPEPYFATGSETTLPAAEAFAAVYGRRPALIDPQDGPCEICAARVSQQCARCGTKDLYGREKTDSMHQMGGNGFQSVKPSHFHLVPVVGVAGREAVFDELCLACYRKDYTAVYGTEPPC